jgi:hypothetical protein
VALGVWECAAPESGSRDRSKEAKGSMRSMLLWFLGVPIPIILLLALCTHHF